MSVKVTFLNDEELIIHDDTYISAWKSEDANDSNEYAYYAISVPAGAREEGTALNSPYPVASLQGLFGSVDWFSLVRSPNKIYKTSAILSLTTI